MIWISLTNLLFGQLIVEVHNKETLKLLITDPLCGESAWWQADSPHKGPVMGKSLSWNLLNMHCSFPGCNPPASVASAVMLCDARHMYCIVCQKELSGSGILNYKPTHTGLWAVITYSCHRYIPVICILIVPSVWYNVASDQTSNMEIVREIGTSVIFNLNFKTESVLLTIIYSLPGVPCTADMKCLFLWAVLKALLDTLKYCSWWWHL